MPVFTESEQRKYQYFSCKPTSDKYFLQAPEFNTVDLSHNSISLNNTRDVEQPIHISSDKFVGYAMNLPNDYHAVWICFPCC